MRSMISIFLCALLLCGCTGGTVAQTVTTAPAETLTQLAAEETVPQTEAAPAVQEASVTEIVLSDGGITVNGGGETEAVFTSHDIIYYEDKGTYESGNPYGEGEDWEIHSAEEAAAHTVVNITAPGTYRLSGTLSAGQIRIDLGEDAFEDPEAVVDLILQDARITCTVAPAILFLNVYECDGGWSSDTAEAEVDTSSAGANLIIEGENTVNGSHVAKIFKDSEEEKKLWKQDGAVYSYMSMNVSGSGSLEINADNEGLDTELHLTVNSGDIRIFANNDGINTNEDGVSVTTVNGGTLTIQAGLGAEGDGIDSNGYLVINGGTVFCSANPAGDAGMDSDLGTYIHGGTVIALGSGMNQISPDSRQVTLNLQFAQTLQPGTELKLTDQEGQILLEYTTDRSCTGVILSSPEIPRDEVCLLYAGDTQLQHTGAGGRPGMGGMQPGQTPPEGFGGEPPEMPEDFTPGEFTPPEEGTMPGRGMGGQRPEGNQPPEGMEAPAIPEGDRSFSGSGTQAGQPSTEFLISDTVTSFSGISPVSQ